MHNMNHDGASGQPHEPAHVAPNLEAYDAALSIVFNLFQLMALAFDPRIDSWEDFGAVVDSVAFDLAAAFPSKMAEKPKRKHFRSE